MHELVWRIDMVTIDVRITEKQLEYLKRIAGHKSVPNQLSDMVSNMINGMMWMDEHKEEVKANGKITLD